MRPPINLKKIPPYIARVRRWSLRMGKAPCDRDKNFSGWGEPEFWMRLDEVLDAYDTGEFDGIGFIVAREDQLGDRQILGGDLDCCRDPQTGEASPWAKVILKRLSTYTEVSPSGCGFRFFCLGKLPEGVDNATGHGSDDLTDEMKAHIIEAKPATREKLATDQPAWNGFEIYEDGPRHLTVTGRKVDEYPADLEYRKDEVLEVIKPFKKGKRPVHRDPDLTSGGSRLPPLNILDVIDTTGFHEEGDELVGPHPTLGSTTGKNLKVNLQKNLWYYFHAGHEAGGDPYLWLAAECGAISIEQAGPGVLSDRVILEKTLKYAVSIGLLTDEQAGLNKAHKPTGPTVIDAIKALDSASSKGFNKFDREERREIIEKAISADTLSTKEERAAYKFIKKYKKQLKELGVDFDNISHIARGEESENALEEINDRIPVWIAEHHFKTVDDTERLYHYDGGVYLDDGEKILKSIIESEFGDITDNKMVADVVGKVKRRTYVNRDLFNNEKILNVKNGLLDLETLQLLPHTPDYLSTAQLDVLFDPDARAPKIAKFLAEVVQKEDLDLIQEIIGWLLWPDYKIHKAIMLLGKGRNGKGTLLNLITAFLGNKNVSNVTLQDLTADRFAKADLYGKLANIGGDLPSKDLSDTAAFRNLTGGDDNRAQEKYRPAFSFRNKAKLMFSANTLPRSPDDTYAFYSRWILLMFLNTFDVQKGTGDPELEEKLKIPEELSGLLNMALAGLARLKANAWKFSYTKTVEDVEVMYKRNANPVLAFLMDECEVSSSEFIEKTVFINKFNKYARDHNIKPLSTTKFGELLRDQTEIPVTDYRPHFYNEAAPRCWLGVKFKPSIPSIVKPTPIFRESGVEGEEENKNKRDKDSANPGRGGLNSGLLHICPKCWRFTDQLADTSAGSLCSSCIKKIDDEAASAKEASIHEKLILCPECGQSGRFLHSISAAICSLCNKIFLHEDDPGEGDICPNCGQPDRFFGEMPILFCGKCGTSFLPRVDEQLELEDLTPGVDIGIEWIIDETEPQDLTPNIEWLREWGENFSARPDADLWAGVECLLGEYPVDYHGTLALSVADIADKTGLPDQKIRKELEADCWQTDDGGLVYQAPTKALKELGLDRPAEFSVLPSNPPPGFTKREHKVLSYALVDLKEKRYPVMISSMYPVLDALGQKDLTHERVRSWLEAMGYVPKIWTQGLEVWVKVAA